MFRMVLFDLKVHLNSKLSNRDGLTYLIHNGYISVQ